MFGNWLINIFLFLFITLNESVALLGQNFEFQILPAETNFTLISADKAAVLSPDGRYLLFAKNADEVQPIASITKLMTALVFVETNPQWDKIYKISNSDLVPGGRLNLFVGDSVNLKDLFLTALVASDNGAATALVSATGLSESEFVALMNKRAQELRLVNTRFVDATGLSAGNVSTAREVALLAKFALAVPEINEAVNLGEYNFNTIEGRLKNIVSTDYLLFDTDSGGLKPMGGKTGYTDLAGYCFVGRFQGPNNEDLVVAVLNSDGRNNRFQESKILINLVLDHYYNSLKN